MKTTKILVQKSETGLSEDNKAKLKSLKIYKDKKHFKFSNGWVDLAYELGKNIEEVCKLVVMVFYMSKVMTDYGLPTITLRSVTGGDYQPST